MSGPDDLTSFDDTIETPKRFSVDNYAYRAVPRLGVRGWLRWGWRQVTSMRLALVLLLLLGLAAIPGSLLPQWPQNAADARTFVDTHAFWGPLADRLGLLDVFGSAWFTAIYVLLFISLVGCIVPRAIAHGKAAREPVGAAPRLLRRFAHHTYGETPLPAADAAKALARWGKGASLTGWVTGYRVRIDERTNREGKPETAVALEQGALREWGNLLFHLALVGVLFALAFGSAYTYRGQAVLVEGRTFTNAVVDYDSYEAGRLYDAAAMEPFTLRLDNFDAQFNAVGDPVSFRADVTYTPPGGEPQSRDIRVNHPLEVADGKVYLQGNGYAPVLTVRDADGNIAFSGPTPFLPQDAAYTSNGVVKVPDVTSGPQIGIVATLYPTAAQSVDGTVSSVNPQLINPIMLLTAYKGDLGLDDGIPQNVYQLDDSGLTQLTGDDGEPLLIDLRPGQTITLPDGLATITWEDTPHFIAVDLRADPSLPWVLLTSLAALLGVGVSLFAPRRRLWIVLRDTPGETPTLVEAAVLAPEHDEAAERALARALAVVNSGAADSPPAEPARQEEVP